MVLEMIVGICNSAQTLRVDMKYLLMKGLN